tara:strand:+ start:3019 stop:3369 length:351 start_codon:yes stop_codon:yes gene_type:complete
MSLLTKRNLGKLTKSNVKELDKFLRTPDEKKNGDVYYVTTGRDHIKLHLRLSKMSYLITNNNKTYCKVSLATPKDFKESGWYGGGSVNKVYVYRKEELFDMSHLSRLRVKLGLKPC